MESTGWCVCLLSQPLLCLPTCLVLGWSMLGVNSRVIVLYDSEAVRDQRNFLVCIVRTDNRYTIAGITGSLTPTKPSPTQKCLLRIPSSRCDREPPASEEDPATAPSRCIQEAKNFNRWLAVPVRRRMELWRIAREHHRITSFEFPATNIRWSPAYPGR